MTPEDFAQALDLRQQEANNALRPPAVEYAPGDAGYGPEFCSNDDCGLDMPAERRQWGCKLCTSCQTADEQKARHVRR
jgi:hypothetical protein